MQVTDNISYVLQTEINSEPYQNPRKKKNILNISIRHFSVKLQAVYFPRIHFRKFIINNNTFGTKSILKSLCKLHSTTILKLTTSDQHQSPIISDCSPHLYALTGKEYIIQRISQLISLKIRFKVE